MNKIILNEKDIKNIVSIILEQDDSDEWVKVSPKRYEEIMQYAGYYGPGVAKLPEYIGKKIWITGDLNLEQTPTKSLDGVYYIDGSLNINSTKISNIDHLKVKGSIWDGNTPREKIRYAKIKSETLQMAQSRREDDEWNLEDNEGDKQIMAAHAIIEFFVDNNDAEKTTTEDKERLIELNKVLENLQEKESEYEEKGVDLTDIHSDIEVTEDEIEEINKKIDVYNLIPDKYDHYGLFSFEVIGYDNLEGQGYCAGTPEEMERAALTYAENQINEGLENFNKHFVEDYIDADEVAEYFREHYENDIRESPESYFDDDDYKLTEEQEKRIEEIENQIEELEERQNNLEHEIEEPSEYSDAYDEVQKQIDTLEEEKDSIEPEVGEPTDEMVDEKVENYVEDAKENPLMALRDFGVDDIDGFVNKDEMAQGIVDTDGVGILNHYNGNYDSVYLNGVEYYVMRIN